MAKRTFYHKEKYGFVKVRENEPNSKDKLICELCGSSNGTVTVDKNELCSSILVTLKVISSVADNLQDSFLHLTLEINKPILEQVQDLMQARTMQPFNFDLLVFQGKEVIDTDTVVLLNISHQAELVALQVKGGTGNKSVKMWRRFKTGDIRLTSTWYMPTGSSWDILKFKAKRNVRIHGIGAFGPVSSESQENWAMRIKYKINETESPVGTFNPSEDLRDEFNCYSISYKDIGLEPFDVSEGVEFFVF